MTPTKILLAAALLGSLGACVTPPTLEHSPWSQIGEGTTTVGVSSGWAFYGADIQAAGTSGVLEGEIGTDNVDLPPVMGGALKMGHFVADNVALGGIVEYRRFAPDPASPLSATLIPDEFDTIHWILTSRYFFEPFGAEDRFKPFVGVDFSYIDEVDFGPVEVDYPGSIPSESIDIKAGSYTTWALVAGASYLWNDHMTVDFGGFYEVTDKAGGTTLTFPNLGGATADVVVEPEGLILFGGVTFYF